MGVTYLLCLEQVVAGVGVAVGPLQVVEPAQQVPDLHHLILLIQQQLQHLRRSLETDIDTDRYRLGHRQRQVQTEAQGTVGRVCVCVYVCVCVVLCCVCVGRVCGVCVWCACGVCVMSVYV